MTTDVVSPNIDDVLGEPFKHQYTEEDVWLQNDNDDLIRPLQGAEFDQALDDWLNEDNDDVLFDNDDVLFDDSTTLFTGAAVNEESPVLFTTTTTTTFDTKPLPSVSEHAQDIGQGFIYLDDARPIHYMCVPPTTKPVVVPPTLTMAPLLALPAPAKRTITKKKKTSTALTSMSWAETKKQGGGRWKWCMMRRELKGIPYPSEKRIIVAYLIQRGICYQRDMVAFVKAHVPKIYETYFVDDDSALKRYIQRARRLPARTSRGPRINWFKCNNVQGRRTVWQINFDMPEKDKQDMAEAYTYYLKRYVEHYALPMDEQAYTLQQTKLPQITHTTPRKRKRDAMSLF